MSPLQAGSYDYYKYEIVSSISDNDSIKLYPTRNAYTVKASYSDPKITDKRGRSPYCKFNTKTLILEVYNKAVITEDVSVAITLTVTNILSDETVTKTIIVTWKYIRPESVGWTDDTKAISHPIVDLLVDVVPEDITFDIVGKEDILIQDGTGYSKYQYFVKTNTPLSFGDYSLSTKMDNGLSDYVTWDKILNVLYIKNGVDLTSNIYKVYMTLTSKYIKGQLSKIVRIYNKPILKFSDGTLEKYADGAMFEQYDYKDIKLSLVGRTNVAVDDSASGIDIYYYLVKAIPLLSPKEYTVTYELEGELPVDGCVTFDTNSLILYVKRGVVYDSAVTLKVKVKELITGKVITKDIIISNEQSYDIIGG